jgi:hypothetical protein
LVDFESLDVCAYAIETIYCTMMYSIVMLR